MKYYAVQVKTAQEDKFILQVNKALEYRANQQRLIFPKRQLKIRRVGKTTMEIFPVFSGYIFIETEQLDPVLFNTFRTTKGFFRFLKSNQEPTELLGKDLATLQHFIHFGPVAESSKVYFDEQDRIIVASGPLKGLEGKIVKINKRKGRAKIQLDIYSENFLLDLAFEVIEKNAQQENT